MTSKGLGHPQRMRGKRKRSPNLTVDRINVIVSIIQNHEGKLSWSRLCTDVLRETGDLYTRQAMNKYIPIKTAFSNHKSHLEKSLVKPKNRKPNSEVAALQRKLSDAEAVRDFLIEKLVRWAVNASTRNLTEEFLDQPLPSINRSENR